MQRASRCRRRARPAVSEVVAAVLLVAITLTLSASVYAYVHVGVHEQPVYTYQSYAVYGSPSILFETINSSQDSAVDQVSVDGASSSSGVLDLSPAGYGNIDALCGPGVTTFFSVDSSAGTLSVENNGYSWVDGVEGQAAQVSAGWHEIIISNASSCAVSLPGGASASYPSASVSTVPAVGSGGDAFLILVPYSTEGHTLTVVFDQGIVRIAF